MTATVSPSETFLPHPTTALGRGADMLRKKNVTPWVEPAVHWETSVGQTWSLDDDPALEKIIDFIVCLGGDGTILWVSNLFPKAVPPVISFAMGSLGFLTAFEEESIPRAVGDVVRGDFFFTPRSRLAAHVVDAHGVEEKLRYVCLNEVVIDRGASAAKCAECGAGGAASSAGNSPRPPKSRIGRLRAPGAGASGAPRPFLLPQPCPATSDPLCIVSRSVLYNLHVVPKSVL